ncbi:carboxypeptidase-like regulatory domain-containing protein [Mucilaginibacter antarcticus]|uniref:Carboxypeptidase-like regulatory domain-containing protein n=1 Tax=Mucilaginibacter antarcticus TaxID=1855725 RepID=A0ABW5XM02_9SPHI
MKIGILNIIFLLMAFCASAQLRLSGRVIDSATLKPLPDAGVYIANTTSGTKANAEGIYRFSNLPPGDYTLMVRYVGYTTKRFDVSLTKDNEDFTVALSAKSIDLKEVTVRLDADWAKNLEMFKWAFLGTNNDKLCRILNQEALNLKFDKTTNILHASSDDFLDIENYVLGYKLRFLVKEFLANYDTHRMGYDGNVTFEQLKGDGTFEDQWKQNRAYAYDGSFRHFLTTLNPGEYVESKFIIKRLIRTPNPARPPDSVISNKIKLLSEQIKSGTGNHATDSLNKWTSLSARPHLNYKLSNAPVSTAEIVKTSSQPGFNALQFDGSLYIIYKGKPQENNFDNLYRFNEAGTWQVSAFNLQDPQKPVLYDKRGITLTRNNLYFEGGWDFRIMKLLPEDYIPGWFNN